MIAALFDCDGTLYTAQMGRGLLRYASDHGNKSAKWKAYAAILPPYLLNKLKLVSREKVNRAYTGSLRYMVRGWTVEAGQQGFAWLANDYLLVTQRPHVIERLRWHQGQGHRVVLVSGGLIPILQEIGRPLDVSDFVGTQVEVQDGRYSGRMLGDVMVGEIKASATQAYFASLGEQVAWPSSYAYADSYHDRAMLGMVGHAVAVHPDPELRAHASERGWEVLEG